MGVTGFNRARRIIQQRRKKVFSLTDAEMKKIPMEDVIYDINLAFKDIADFVPLNFKLDDYNLKSLRAVIEDQRKALGEPEAEGEANAPAPAPKTDEGKKTEALLPKREISRMKRAQLIGLVNERFASVTGYVPIKEEDGTATKEILVEMYYGEANALVTGIPAGASAGAGQDGAAGEKQPPQA